jgi:CelD/BcsL family acetyltransferase involved in cellulose biosynthesis
LSQIEIHIVRTVEEFRSLDTEWSDFHAAAGGTLFQTFTWLWNWWRVYREDRNELHIITARADGRLTAILPLYLERIGGFGLGLKRLRMLGVYETYGEYTILTGRTEFRESVRSIADELARCLKAPRCDLVTLFRFPPESEAMGELMKQLRLQGLHGTFVPVVIKRVMMELPPTWERYLAGLTPNEREGIKRKTRALLKKDVEVEIVRTPDHAAFDDYVRLHGESWGPRGVTGYFSSERFSRFLCDATMELMSAGRSRLYFLKKDGRRFAAVHAMFVNGQCCFYLSGLDRNHELVHMSPGKVLLSMVIRDAIQEGYTLFDFQGGDEDYKFRLGGKITSFAKAMFWPRGIRSVKIMLFLGLQSLRQGLRWRIMDRLIPYVRSLLSSARSVHPPPAHRPAE